MNPKGAVAIVTGSSSGVGAATAKLLAQKGANVVINYASNHDGAIKAAEACQALGVEALICQGDVADDNACKNIVGQTLEKFGRIDVLVNNAGITKDNLLLRMSEEDFNAVMKVNMNSVFNNTKAVLRQMLKQKNGSIINLSSVVGVKGNAGQSNYSSSKAAIIGFTKSVALELGSRNIRCNAIAPGFIETEMTKALQQDQINEWAESIPLKRSGKPEDVANTSLFLASDMSSYITGQVMNVCGGMLT